MSNDTKKIMKAVKRHHQYLEDQGYHVVFTSLIGSQNYDLADENSDIDTYSFIYPTFDQFAAKIDPEIKTIRLDDGQCNIKDVRTALYLLQNTSPNSVEYFTSKYKVYNPIYKDILSTYLKDGCDSKLWYMTHSNYRHMYNAIIGMSIQLTQRNMPAGKRYSHALRLEDMADHFRISPTAGAILEMSQSRRELAMRAKRSTNEEYYNELCKISSDELKETYTTIHDVEWQKEIEEAGRIYIQDFARELFKRYINVLNGGY